jgi:aryl-alcohol dehydrogenase-like predicted oxidoreductase
LLPILYSLLADAERGEFRDFAAAEQAAMAANSVLAAFEAAGAVEAGKLESLRGRIDALFERVKDENRYEMASFVSALRDLRRAAG